MRAIDSQHYCGLKYTTGAIFFKSYVDQSSHLLIAMPKSNLSQNDLQNKNQVGRSKSSSPTC